MGASEQRTFPLHGRTVIGMAPTHVMFSVFPLAHLGSFNEGDLCCLCASSVTCALHQVSRFVSVAGQFNHMMRAVPMCRVIVAACAPRSEPIPGGIGSRLVPWPQVVRWRIS